MPEGGSSLVESEARGSASNSSTGNDRRASAGSSDEDGGALEGVDLGDREHGAEDFGDGRWRW
jgi:hypothetical protein